MCRRSIVMLSVVLCADVSALEDPTRPPLRGKQVQTASPAATPSLQTVLVGPERRLAMIDDRVMAVGDRFGAIELVQVDADSVVVRTDAGQRIRLTLRSKKILKEAK